MPGVGVHWELDNRTVPFLVYVTVACAGFVCNSTLELAVVIGGHRATNVPSDVLLRLPLLGTSMNKACGQIR